MLKLAVAWENHHAEKLESEGFDRGVACGVSFDHPGRDLSLTVHGDDFTFCGMKRDLEWVAGK